MNLLKNLGIGTKYIYIYISVWDGKNGNGTISGTIIFYPIHHKSVESVHNKSRVT